MYQNMKETETNVTTTSLRKDETTNDSIDMKNSTSELLSIEHK
jgi:hypothetical protein